MRKMRTQRNRYDFEVSISISYGFSTLPQMVYHNDVSPPESNLLFPTFIMNLTCRRQLRYKPNNYNLTATEIQYIRL